MVENIISKSPSITYAKNLKNYGQAPDGEGKGKPTEFGGEKPSPRPETDSRCGEAGAASGRGSGHGSSMGEDTDREGVASRLLWDRDTGVELEVVARGSSRDNASIWRLVRWRSLRWRVRRGWGSRRLQGKKRTSLGLRRTPLLGEAEDEERRWLVLLLFHQGMSRTTRAEEERGGGGAKRALATERGLQ
ncbi:hypothetical protein GW17_00036202 [Ensete ventricosum]|nr:hypothetical protein GW17_00036202 [Ensete ventricosum]RZS03760.1 hypothetical protein BHM03_00033971 [Ensete ventricosum]